jgi:hypothetical protein
MLKHKKMNTHWITAPLIMDSEGSATIELARAEFLHTHHDHFFFSTFFFSGSKIFRREKEV